ncbi:hypothetical protein GE09DRAFT_1205660 [Coniochaeta sp. 2T2.1]|nr:hypothetical protein GE09DRAFT_1205660 [Coniochaeta sp. 2T2.1]
MQTHQPFTPQPPIIFQKDAQSVSNAGSELCDNLRQHVADLVSTVSPADATFDNVLVKLLQHENEMQLTSNLVTLYSLVGTDGSQRSAAETSQKISHTQMDCKENADLFRLVNAVYERQKDDPTLDVESRKALTEERRSYVRKGMDLAASNDDNEACHKVRDIARQLCRISSEFMRNLDEKEHSIWLTRQDLAGVPDDALSGLEIGTEEMDGKFRLDLNGPEVRWFITMASCPTTREMMYLGTRRVAKENAPLFSQAIQLRHRSAHLLGYPSHFAYKVEVTMAKTPAAVIELLDGIRRRLIRRLPKDLEKLMQLKKDDSAVRVHDNVILWSDIPYYSRIYEERNYSLDQSLIAEYFPLYQTVSKLLALFAQLFGFVFTELTDVEGQSNALEQGLIWHPDVRVYSVWNDDQEGGEFAGYLYLDLHPRPGKSGGAQCRPLHLGFERPDEKRHYPSTVLLTNFSRPTSEKPSLLRHAEVVLLFHELGHGIHDLSGRCKYSRFHGAETVMDFNEAPSQIAILPAIKLLPQLRMTLFDTAVHSTPTSKDGTIDVEKIYADYAELGGIKNSGDDYGYASYRHLFSGNDAGMYSYLWSKVLAMDMFDTFFKHNALDYKEGRRYRHLILEKGGSQDEMATLVEFLGREPTPDAFYRSLGLE